MAESPYGSARQVVAQDPQRQSDANIGFEDLRGVLLHLGFGERVRGSHHVFFKVGIEELVNLQRSGNKAKPYQVRQVRSIVTRYRLGSDQ